MSYPKTEDDTQYSAYPPPAYTYGNPSYTAPAYTFADGSAPGPAGYPSSSQPAGGRYDPYAYNPNGKPQPPTYPPYHNNQPGQTSYPTPAPPASYPTPPYQTTPQTYQAYPPGMSCRWRADWLSRAVCSTWILLRCSRVPKFGSRISSWPLFLSRHLHCIAATEASPRPPSVVHVVQDNRREQERTAVRASCFMFICVCCSKPKYFCNCAAVLNILKFLYSQPAAHC